jgi:hypothetical protein
MNFLNQLHGSAGLDEEYVDARTGRQMAIVYPSHSRQHDDGNVFGCGASPETVGQLEAIHRAGQVKIGHDHCRR